MVTGALRISIVEISQEFSMFRCGDRCLKDLTSVVGMFRWPLFRLAASFFEEMVVLSCQLAFYVPLALVAVFLNILTSSITSLAAVLLPLMLFGGVLWSAESAAS